MRDLGVEDERTWRIILFALEELLERSLQGRVFLPLRYGIILIT